MVSTTCEKLIRMDEQDVMIMLLETTNVQIAHEGNHTVEVPYDKTFEKPLTFLQTRKGDIIRIIHDKDEKPSVISIKKSILSNFVIKLAGQTSEENTQAGKVKFSYEKAITKEGRDIILKKAVEVLEQPDPAMKTKDQKYQHIAYIQVNKDGKIHKVYTEQGSKVGADSERRQKVYKQKKEKVGQEEHPDDFTAKAGNAFNFGAKTTIRLIRTGHLEGDKVELDEPKDVESNGLGSASGNSTEEVKTMGMEEFDNQFDSSQKVGTLALDPALIQEAFEYKRQTLSQEVHFPTLLSQLKENPKSNELLAKAHSYVNTLGDESLDHVIQEYSKLNVETELDYAISLMSLYTVSQTEKGQNELIKVMDHKLTLQQAIINSLALKNPSEKMINTLKKISNEKYQEMDETDNHILNTNAYLAYVHTASKSDGERSHQILEEISQNIDKVQSLREFEKEVHALTNAGDIVPLEAISVIAVNEDLPLELRVAAIKGLGLRTSLESHEHVTNLLQHLTEKQYNEAIRTSAVHSLTKREAEIQDASSLEFLRQYLEDVDTPATLVHAIKEYNLEVDSEHSHGILDATKLGLDDHIGDRDQAVKVMQLEGYFDEEQETEDENKLLEAKPLGWRAARRFFRRVANRVRSVARRVISRVRSVARNVVNRVRTVARRIGSKIKETAKKVGRAVVSAAKAVYDKTIGAVVGKVKGFIDGLKKKFSKAQFKGEKVCIQSNSKGDRLCMYDEDMIAFIRKQGDLSQMKWSKQFSFEKLIGVEIMHAYIGMVGYAGTRIDCATNSFDIVIFGRGEAKARLFGRRVPILVAELELQKRTESELVDRAYISVFKAVIFNQQFVPEKIRRFINSCEKTSRPLVKPVRKPLVNFSFTVVVVIVPLTFTISVTAEMGVDLVNIICPGRLTLTASIEPYVGIGIDAKCGVGFAIVSGGVQASFDANYRLQPGFGTSNCNLCAVLEHTVRPITITISLYLKALSKTWNVKLYQFQGPVIRGTLFKYCLFKDKPYDPESVINGPPPEAPAAPEPNQGSGSSEQPAPDQTSQGSGSNGETPEHSGSNGKPSGSDTSSETHSNTPSHDSSSGSSHSTGANSAHSNTPSHDSSSSGSNSDSSQSSPSSENAQSSGSSPPKVGYQDMEDPEGMKSEPIGVPQGNNDVDAEKKREELKHKRELEKEERQHKRDMEREKRQEAQIKEIIKPQPVGNIKVPKQRPVVIQPTKIKPPVAVAVAKPKPKPTPALIPKDIKPPPPPTIVVPPLPPQLQPKEIEKLSRPPVSVLPPPVQEKEEDVPPMPLPSFAKPIPVPTPVVRPAPFVPNPIQNQNPVQEQRIQHEFKQIERNEKRMKERIEQRTEKIERNIQRNNIPKIQSPNFENIEKIISSKPKTHLLKDKKVSRRKPKRLTNDKSMRLNFNRNRRTIRRSENREKAMLHGNSLISLLRSETKRSSSLIRNLNNRFMNEIRKYNSKNDLEEEESEEDEE